ncbi:MAG: hypothetical protein MJZ05_10965 [Fibrobacter sp.]|nr:hypothetical protein [Fibrobacter sp.]
MKNSFPSVILSVAKNLAMLSIAAVMFVACGGDNGSSAKDDEIDSSSSGVILSDSEESSSSVVKSSSSAKESSSSSEAKSSSSSSVILSSSSEGSSSSAKSSSSVASSSSAKSSSSTAKSSSSIASSSSAKSSSSSVKISSSSSYVPFDHAKFLSKAKYEDGVYKQFTDERTGRSYYYITITGRDTSYKANSVTVMAENLNIGEMVRGRTNQEDDSKIERYCYDNDTTNCDKYGGLYQWAEMMALPSRCNTESCADLIQENHQGICPEGWRLLTYNDMYTIVHADGNEDGIKGVRSVPFGGFNTTGYSLVGAGYLWNNRFEDVNAITYWYYPEEGIPTRGKVSSTSNTGTSFQLSAVDKTNGLSVRCVMVE